MNRSNTSADWTMPKLSYGNYLDDNKLLPSNVSYVDSLAWMGIRGSRKRFGLLCWGCRNIEKGGFMKTRARAPILSFVVFLAPLVLVSACGKDPVATTPKSGPTCVAASDSIVGWWPLDQLGSAAEELVGDNHGDYVEIPLEAEGKVGGALRFDGSNDVIEIRDPGADWDYDIAGDITLETWINRDTNQISQQVIVGKYNSYYIGCRNGRIFALISNAADLIGATNLPTGEWIHVAVTYDVDDRIAKIYLN
ncbi:MAG: LamG-like jellyroll fold domain-containing protein, partial [Planctomycetota bacterium]